MKFRLFRSRAGTGRRSVGGFPVVVVLGVLAIILSACVSSISADRVGTTSTPPMVTVQGGALRGKTADGANEFLGIPYAAPPVGELRWKAPQPAADWSGVREATDHGANCAQPGSPLGVKSDSEDCLFLNVYTPEGDVQHSEKRPVLVWIHGGGWRVGEGEDYNPVKLAGDGTVVVTINYRLGALGFLAHPALTDKATSSGAYGLLDQQAALQWVQKNVRSFGGDPKNVTIAGQSAGGLSVLMHLASPAAKGLFQRAIVQTGAFALTQTPLAKAEAAGETFAAMAGCESQSAECLRKLPVSVVLDKQENKPTGYVPGVVDGTVLKQSIGTALASGEFNRVPILNGSTHDEARLFIGIDELSGVKTTAANYQDRIAATLGVPAEAVAAIAAQYPPNDYPTAALALSAVGSDAISTCSALHVSNLVSKYVPTFAYEFNDENAPQRFLPPVKDFPYGAYHTAETQYLFDLPTAPIHGSLTAQQQHLAEGMQKYWASFAATGAPSAEGHTSWPAFDHASQKLLSLQPEGSKVTTDFANDHKCDFWSSTK